MEGERERERERWEDVQGKEGSVSPRFDKDMISNSNV